MDYITKKHRAGQILEMLKDELMFILWDTSPNEYGTLHNLFPWIEEETEYMIKDLSLNKEDEGFFLRKVHELMGEYSELIPLLKRRRL